MLGSLRVVGIFMMRLGAAGPAYDDVREGAADIDTDAQVPAHSAACGSSSSSK